ncbi:unnamed protein product, partial [Didymodactylos carnosus]
TAALSELLRRTL